MGRAMGLDLGRQRALGLRAFALWPLGTGGIALVLGAGPRAGTHTLGACTGRLGGRQSLATAWPAARREARTRRHRLVSSFAARPLCAGLRCHARVRTAYQPDRRWPPSTVLRARAPRWFDHVAGRSFWCPPYGGCTARQPRHHACAATAKHAIDDGAASGCRLAAAASDAAPRVRDARVEPAPGPFANGSAGSGAAAARLACQRAGAGDESGGASPTDGTSAAGASADRDGAACACRVRAAARTGVAARAANACRACPATGAKSNGFPAS